MAASDYVPASTVYRAVKEVVATLQTELEVYRAVTDVASTATDSAAADFEARAASAARQRSGRP